MEEPSESKTVTTYRTQCPVASGVQDEDEDRNRRRLWRKTNVYTCSGVCGGGGFPPGPPDPRVGLVVLPGPSFLSCPLGLLFVVQFFRSYFLFGFLKVGGGGHRLILWRR